MCNIHLNFVKNNQHHSDKDIEQHRDDCNVPRSSTGSIYQPFHKHFFFKIQKNFVHQQNYSNSPETLSTHSHQQEIPRATFSQHPTFLPLPRMSKVCQTKHNRIGILQKVMCAVECPEHTGRYLRRPCLFTHVGSVLHREPRKFRSSSTLS